MFGIHCWGGNAQFTKAPVFATCVVPEGVSYADACVLGVPRAGGVEFAGAARQAAARRMGAGDGSGRQSRLDRHPARVSLGALSRGGSGRARKIGAELGADHIINYGKSDLKDEIMRITHGKGVDIVYDNIAVTYGEGDRRALG